MSVEFLPVEVTKEFMSLTVGDILRVNPKTGRYELRQVEEDLGEGTYRTSSYEISLEPWIIQKYMDHFQVMEEEKPKEVVAAERAMTPEEASKQGYAEVTHSATTECPDCEVTYTGPREALVNANSDEIESLRANLEEMKEMFADIQAKLAD